MKEGWKYKEFERCLIKVPKQKAVKSKDYLEEGKYPIVSQESYLISGYTDDEALLYKHERPVVIFGDHTKNVKYINFDFVVGADGVHILSPIEDILPKFFYYELRSIKLRELGYARYYKLLKEKNIYYPSLPEQQRIVDLLDAEFDKIDTLKTNAEHQLQAAKDLFQSSLKEMLTPKEGWEEKSLLSLCEKVSNIKWSANSGIRKYIDLSSVSRESLSITDNIEVNYINAPSRAKQIIYENDILFATTRPTLRRVCRVNEDYNEQICSTGFCVLRPSAKLNSDYLFFNLIADRFYDYIEPLQTGASYPAVTDNVVKAYNIYLPKIEDQRQIVERLESVYKDLYLLQANYTETITLCNDLKQALLKSIFQ